MITIYTQGPYEVLEFDEAQTVLLGTFDGRKTLMANFTGPNHIENAQLVKRLLEAYRSIDLMGNKGETDA